MKNIRVFYLKKFSFLEVKFSIYLNRRVFVMFNILMKTFLSISEHGTSSKTTKEV